MIFILILLITIIPLIASDDILVRREQDYDTVVWDGECSRINANTIIFDKEKTCVCKKKFDVDGIKTELNGFFYQNTDGVPACFYDYRETGANFFIQPRYSTGIHVIDDTSRDERFLTQGADRIYALRYSLNIHISIKEVRLYNFNKNNPFTAIPNDIFDLRSRNVTNRNNPNARITRQWYLIQVNLNAIKKVQGNLVQIRFEEERKEDKLKRDVGFTIVKFVGDATYNLNLSETSQKDTYKIATIALAVIAGILALVIVVLIVKLRYKKSKENKKKITTTRMTGMHDEHISSHGKKTINDYKDFDDDDNTAIAYITANESSNPNNITQEEPVYETSDPLELNKNSRNNVQTMRDAYYNGNYWYDEIKE